MSRMHGPSKQTHAFLMQSKATHLLQCHSHRICNFPSMLIRFNAKDHRSNVWMPIENCKLQLGVYTGLRIFSLPPCAREMSAWEFIQQENGREVSHMIPLPRYFSQLPVAGKKGSAKIVLLLALSIKFQGKSQVKEHYWEKQPILQTKCYP